VTLIWDGLRQAVRLVIGLDREVLGITWLSLQVAGTAKILALLVGIPLGTLIALTRFPGRAFVISLDRYVMLQTARVSLWNMATATAHAAGLLARLGLPAGLAQGVSLPETDDRPTDRPACDPRELGQRRPTEGKGLFALRGACRPHARGNSL
jgi:hypothetical protein